MSDPLNEMPRRAVIGGKAIVGGGLVVFLAIALAVTISAFRASILIGLLWLLVGLPIAYGIAYVATRTVGSAFLYVANPAGRRPAPLPGETRRERRAEPRTPGYVGRGWIDTLSGDVVDGLFDGGRDDAIPAALLFRADDGRTFEFAWEKIDWAWLQGRTRYLPEVVQEHPGTFDVDENELVTGAASWLSDLRAFSSFNFAAIGERTGDEWIRRFRLAGADLKTYPRGDPRRDHGKL